MKVVRLRLKNYKRFGNLELDFTDSFTGEPEPLTLIQGRNGSGKTTILQAIAAMLGVATGRLTSLRDLQWPGYRFDLASDAWPESSELELQVQFSQTELDATEHYWEQLLEYEPNLGVRPAKQPLVTLRRQGDKVVAEQPAQLFQFHARSYASRLWTHNKKPQDPFFEVGTSISYHVHREPIRSHKSNKKSPDRDKLNPDPSAPDEQAFRQALSSLDHYHQKYGNRGGQRDYFLELQNIFQRVFPGRRLDGADLDRRSLEPMFYFHDGEHRYELSELSGGEKAILPILYDFIKYNINYSVVMIDEIELHLNPMLHQAFVRALSALGHENQFIFTSHSRQVNTVMSGRKVINLDCMQ